MSFLTEYFDIEDTKEEVAVCCPFPHSLSNGEKYYETHPSAHVNTEKNLFHCKVCGEKGNEITMIQKILDCPVSNARKLARCFETDETIYDWEELELTAETEKRLDGFNISDKVRKDLCIKTPPFTNNIIGFPVTMFEHFLDFRSYDPGNTPKVKSRLGSPTGLIIPFDIWRHSPTIQVTLICAGEKDMAVARTHGFNAITITGGEQTLPIQNSYFKDRLIAIVYDNDDTGRTGACKLADHLLKYTPYVKVVTNFHEGMENKEDITDYFNKYNHTREDLIDCIENTPVFKGTPKKEIHYKTMNLLEASRPENLDTVIQTNIQVEAVSEATFACPARIVAEKTGTSGVDDSMFEGDTATWELTDSNAQDILKMIDNNIKEDAMRTVYKNVVGVLKKEKYIAITIPKRVTVFKCFVTDMFETTDTTAQTQPMEFTAYSINHKLESGQKYLITHKIVPNTNKGQQLISIILNAEQANDSVSKFVLDDKVKQSLQTIQDIPGDVHQKMNDLTEKVKGLLGYDGINTLIQSIDLAFNTPLLFNFNQHKNIRAYLDTIVVGESRTGKSSTATCLRNLYGLGTFTSLAGNSATIPGLVGGSNKTATGFQTKAGIIPQNHKGLIIFEEFGKSNNTVITELTDIRSSNEVRITRVAGTIALPAMVRMITLSNPKNKNGNIQPIASYPNGIAVLTDLVEAAEDIARYDLIVILPDKGKTHINPLWEAQEPLPTKVYRDRIRWIWSRTADQIILSKEVMMKIVEQANYLNDQYEGHIKIFGTECWKKLSRLTIAVAGYLCSTDETYENIIVTEEHVDYATEFMINLYDNQTFKLKEYVNYEKQYSEIDEEGVTALQNIYDKNPMLVLQLEQCSSTSRNILMAATGMEQNDLHKALNLMTKTLFVKYHNHDIIPTERFRKGLARIRKDSHAERLGELHAEVSMELTDPTTDF